MLRRGTCADQRIEDDHRIVVSEPRRPDLNVPFAISVVFGRCRGAKAKIYANTMTQPYPEQNTLRSLARHCCSIGPCSIRLPLSSSNLIPSGRALSSML